MLWCCTCVKPLLLYVLCWSLVQGCAEPVLLLTVAKIHAALCCRQVLSGVRLAWTSHTIQARCRCGTQ